MGGCRQSQPAASSSRSLDRVTRRSTGFVELAPNGQYLLRFFRPRSDGPISAAPGLHVSLRRQLGLGQYGGSADLRLPAVSSTYLKVGLLQRDILVAELSPEGRESLRVSLPPARQRPGTRLTESIRIKLEAGGIGQVVLEDDDLLRALSFLHSGQLRDARRLIEPIVEQLKERQPQDAVEAIVAGYVLLATHELDGNASWCADLPAREPWLPDALVIAAEWFAVGGHHLTASAYLRQLEDVGLPVFTYGYERAVARLGLYASQPLARPHNPHEHASYAPERGDVRTRMAQQLAPWDRGACEQVLASLARWSPSIDRSAPTLTIRSLSVARGRSRSLGRFRTTLLRQALTTLSGSVPGRRGTMSSTTDTPSNQVTEQSRILGGAALAAAALALLLWAVFTAFMIVKANTDSEVQWARLAYLFASVEAVAFGAAGAMWGTTINRQRAEQAEQRAAVNERDASNGRALAASQIAEAGDLVDLTSDSALQRMGGGPERAASEVLQRHAKQARLLFPDL